MPTIENFTVNVGAFNIAPDVRSQSFGNDPKDVEDLLKVLRDAKTANAQVIVTNTQKISGDRSYPALAITFQNSPTTAVMFAGTLFGTRSYSSMTFIYDGGFPRPATSQEFDGCATLLGHDAQTMGGLAFILQAIQEGLASLQQTKFCFRTSKGSFGTFLAFEYNQAGLQRRHA